MSTMVAFFPQEKKGFLIILTRSATISFVVSVFAYILISYDMLHKDGSVTYFSLFVCLLITMYMHSILNVKVFHSATE